MGEWEQTRQPAGPRQERDGMREREESGAVSARPLSLYLHVPFCVRKCYYCDFLSAPAAEGERDRYVRLLLTEIALCSRVYGRRQVDTVFFGGGTPSLLSAGQLQALMDGIREGFSLLPEAEVSMEANPGTVTPESLAGYRRAGVNRLSLGVQSFSDRELALIGRIHSAAQAREAVAMARAAGFSNLNLDLISALPGQKLSDWERNLRAAAELSPEHLSCYSLILEEGTAFARMSLPSFPDEEEDREMVHFTKAFLQEQGYARYEISNYARPGHECRHNLGYWRRHEYLGLGLGSSSLVGEERFHNPAELPRYAELMERAEAVQNRDVFEPQGTEQDREILSLLHEERAALGVPEQMEEFMFLGLRLSAGVSEEEFARAFGQRIDAVYGPVLARQEREGLLVRSGGRIFLTDRGLDLEDYVSQDYCF